jgi:Methyltransferase domain
LPASVIAFFGGGLAIALGGIAVTIGAGIPELGGSVFRRTSSGWGLGAYWAGAFPSLAIIMTSEFEQLAPSEVQLRDGKDSLAMQALAPLSQTYLPWSGYAMRPSGVVKILNEMVINQRSTVVECGAGLTTVYIASLMRQQGKGHLYTIEHDAAWVAVVRGLLAQGGLESYVTLIHAPLVVCELSLEGTDWYDRGAIAAALGDRVIDLLVVDGPPAYDAARRYARYPAAVYFQGQMAADYAVVLDDIDRAGEQHVMAQWELKLPGLVVQRLVTDGGVAIGSSRSGFSVS